MSTEFTSDRNVEAVKAKMDERAKVGFSKYGVTTERPDLSLADWLTHALEESLDLPVYLQAAIETAKAQQAEIDRLKAEVSALKEELAESRKSKFVTAADLLAVPGVQELTEQLCKDLDAAASKAASRWDNSAEDFANELFHATKGDLA